MDIQKKKIMRIELNYAASQATFWSSFCAIASFIAIWLGYKGLNNTQIGLTTSLGSFLAITLQLIMSNILDKYPDIRIKKLIATLLTIGVGAAAVLQFIQIPTAMMIICFSVLHSVNVSSDSYLNAQLVQFNNAGVPAKYGWPRGMGSLGYAIAAYVYGALVEKYTPKILMPIYMGGIVICILLVLLMPVPQVSEEKRQERKAMHHTSYREMLMSNKVLLVFLVCTMLNSMGNMAGYTFIMRVVERLDSGMVEYGISEFIRAFA